MNSLNVSIMRGGAPAPRRGLGEVEAAAGSCGPLKCWVWLPIGAGAGVLFGLVATAVIRAVLRRGGSR